MAQRTKEGFWDRFSRIGVILILLYVMFVILGFAVRLLLFPEHSSNSIMPGENLASANGSGAQAGAVTDSQTAVTESATSENPTQAPAASGEGPIVGLAIDQNYLAVVAGGTTSVAVNMTTTAQAGASDLVWSSSDPAIATVDEAGLITGVQTGTCTITVAARNDEAISASVPLTVRQLQTVDGCTYVDGVLIVNKTYGLPADYDPGLEDYVAEAFQAMQDAAAEEGLNLYIGSDYRDYDYQVTIYGNYSQLYGWEVADTFSARPGHSEHQTGLTIDCNSIDDSFGDTPEATWLAEHCAEYGFIIRFPEGKEDITGYQYEPWHIRYVGPTLATEIYTLGISLEEYLGVDSAYTGPWEGSDQTAADTDAE